MRRVIGSGLVRVACLAPLAVFGIAARAETHTDIDDLLALDISRLVNVQVTLSSRVAENAFDAPAAVYVLSRDEILRAGHRRLPEALRMVPGLHVGKWDANKWAISSRNAMNRFSSTMLVMIDGRHVYTPLYGGVRWEIQDVFIEDIERIEIIRGPGGPLWGANAVDGIVNVVTRSAAQTQGVLAYAGVGGGEMNHEAGARYGGRLGEAGHYRVFAKAWQSDVGEYENRALSTHNGRRPAGEPANDQGESWMTGLRADWRAGERDAFSLQANAFRSRFDEERTSSTAVWPNQVDYRGANAMLHWRREPAPRESLELRVVLDRVDLADDILEEEQTLFDLDFQHSFARAAHTVTWGLGYRYYRSETALPAGVPCSACFGLYNSVGINEVWSAFVQDQWAFADQWVLLVGAKFEHNGYTGFENQPTLRLSWHPTPVSTLWAAGTQAVRVPTRVDRERASLKTPPALVGPLGCVEFRDDGACLAGNPDRTSWRVNTYELGYRVQATNRLAFDFAAFDNHFAGTRQGNDASGRSRVKGLEGVMRWQGAAAWTLELGYTWHVGKDARSDGSTSPTLTLPEHSAHLRSAWQPAPGWTADLMVYWNGGFDRATSPPFPGYTRVDARLGWQVTPQVELGLWLSNLTDPAHSEYIEQLKLNTAVRRGGLFSVRVTL